MLAPNQPFCEACRRSPAKRQTEVMDDRVQSRRPSGRWSQHPFSKALSEDLTTAQDGIATEAAGNHLKLDDPPRERQIAHVPSIPAMDTSGNRSARWTETNASGGPDRNDGLIAFVVRTFYNPRGTRLERWSACCMAVDSPQSKRQTSLELHQK